MADEEVFLQTMLLGKPEDSQRGLRSPFGQENKATRQNVSLIREALLLSVLGTE